MILWECDNCSLYPRPHGLLRVPGSFYKTQSCLSFFLLGIWMMLLSWKIVCSMELTSSKENGCWLLCQIPKPTINKENREWICDLFLTLAELSTGISERIEEFLWFRKRSIHLYVPKAQCPGIWPATVHLN